jgi:hypothetical protein
MNSKVITLVILGIIVGLVCLFPGEDTIKPSGKPKALKAQGLLMAALGFISIF